MTPSCASSTRSYMCHSSFICVPWLILSESWLCSHVPMPRLTCLESWVYLPSPLMRILSPHPLLSPSPFSTFPILLLLLVYIYLKMYIHIYIHVYKHIYMQHGSLRRCLESYTSPQTPCCISYLTSSLDDVHVKKNIWQANQRLKTYTYIYMLIYKYMCTHIFTYICEGPRYGSRCGGPRYF